ncbi:MAG: Transcriptional activator of fatty acid utilization [Phylliscum demangeonii]|nr:MAG: Transcriptional activator of fatty acid utilization [Phylliscum demangeonii]
MLTGDSTSTTLCLLHRAHMPPATAPLAGQRHGSSDDAAYPSTTIAFQAAAMITSIAEHLSTHHELHFCPAFIVYSVFSALILHVHQMRSSVPSVVLVAQERINVCLSALREISRVWLVAKLVLTLFEYILNNKALEDKLQKAAGKRHAGFQKPAPTTNARKEGLPKRKYDDMDLAYTNGPPVAHVSYERSRPQTPLPMPSREFGPPPTIGSTMPAPMHAISSPRIRHQTEPLVGYGGGSQAITRAPTPFNPAFSIPSTPPDLFLVTRNSPQISQNVWENFQPDQLFPEKSSAFAFGPGQMLPPNIDPQLASPFSGVVSPMGAPSTAAAAWPHQFEGLDLSAAASDDAWSSDFKGPIVPTTLNLEDW